MVPISRRLLASTLATVLLASAAAIVAVAAMRTADAAPPPGPHAPGEHCADLRGATAVDYYCASSVLAPQSGIRYGVDNLFSNTSNEAWVEGAPGQGIGEWVTIDFKEPRSVKAVIIRNGYQKRPDLFAKNSRVRTFRLVFSDGQTQSLTVRDSMDLQKIPLEPPVTTTLVQFVITDVYPGTAYTDTAITKLWLTSEILR